MKAAWNRYWHDFPIERSRLAMLRVPFFLLLGLDLVLVTLEHAPRYGSGGFNVSHLPGFVDRLLPTPTTAVVTVGWLLGAFLALRAALGVAVRQSMVGVAICYGGIYFWSQADSYQHHYLVSLLLVLWCCLPTDAARLPRAGEPKEVRHWAARLIYVQIAFLYLWAALTKCNAEWLSGATMESLTRGPEVRELMFGMADRFGIARENIFAVSAWVTMLGEFFAALCFVWRRLWWIGLLVIPWFHVMVEVLDFDIEWFSYYMILLDVVLLMPGKVVNGVVDAFAPAARRLAALLARLPGGRPTAPGVARVVAGVAAVACGALAATSPVEGTAGFAVAAAALALMAAWPRGEPPRPLAALGGQVLAMGVVAGLLLTTEVAYDYYRLWGGDLRRRDDLEASAMAYERANALKPDGTARWFQLGKVYAELGRPDDALKAFEISVERHKGAITVQQTAVHRAAARPELRFELAELHEGLSERCQRLVVEYRRRQRRDEAEEAVSCARRHLEEAVTAYTGGLQLAPRDGRGLRGLSRARRDLQRVVQR